MRSLRQIVHENERLLHRRGCRETMVSDSATVVHSCRRTIERIDADIKGCVLDFCRDFEYRFGNAPEHKIPHIIESHEERAKSANLAGWSLITFKTILWILFGPVVFGFVPLTASLIGGALSFVLSLSLKNAIALWVVRPGLTPVEQDDRSHSILWVSLSFTLAALGALFVVRSGIGETENLLPVLVVLSSLDLALLVLAGVMFGKKLSSGWSGHHSRHCRDLLDCRQQFEQQLLQAEIRICGMQQPSSPSVGRVSEHPRILSNVAAIGIIVILATTSVPLARAQGPKGLQPRSPKSAVPVVQLAGTADSPGHGEIDIDVSSSVDKMVLKQVLPNIAGNVSRWALQASVPFWDVEVLEGDGWIAQPVARIVSPNRRVSPCLQNPSKGEAIVFRQLADRITQKHLEKCEAWRLQQIKIFYQKLAPALSGAVLTQPARRVGCTSLYDVLARLSRLPDNSVALLITDGIESCVKPRTLVRPERNVTLIVVLLASAGDIGKSRSASYRFEERKKRLSASVPWISGIVAPFELDDLNLPLTSSDAEYPDSVGKGEE
jgi:hypothetical protein